jgi:hypothetical protein
MGNQLVINKAEFPVHNIVRSPVFKQKGIHMIGRQGFNAGDVGIMNGLPADGVSLQVIIQRLDDDPLSPKKRLTRFLKSMVKSSKQRKF